MSKPIVCILFLAIFFAACEPVPLQSEGEVLVFLPTVVAGETAVSIPR